MQKQRFLVGRMVDGAFRKASDSGYVCGAGACHPLVEGMTEADHDAICRAAWWMAGESLRPNFVELTGDSAYRVSFF